ncbi:MAG: nucleotidyltransferase, partial [Bacteroidota bacterium]
MSVQSYLTNLASNLVLTEKEKESIGLSISTLEGRVNSYFGSAVLEKFKFGSYTRSTILSRKVDYKSDIDYMLVFENKD